MTTHPFPDVMQIVESLRFGGVIIYPTDTIWGIGCDAGNVSAIKKVYELKQRVPDKPLIVLVSDLEMLNEYVSGIHPRIEALLFYHEKPLTVIYNQVRGLPDILRGENGSVAIRLVKDPYCRAFIHEFGKPVVSTSVNISETPAPVHFAEISFDLLNAADYVSKYRRDDVFEAKASSIIRFDQNGKITFLR
jgi:L-threonylcarbamoyladenylate synthase